MNALRLAASSVLVTCLGAGSALAALPTLSIADASGLEGDAAASFIQFPVTLSAPSATDVTVHAQVAFGTTSTDDQKTSTGDLTIKAGETSTIFYAAIFGDVTVEPDETFTVTLSAPVGATLARGTATGTILNDDALGVPVARIASVEVGEGNTGAKSALFTVTLSPAPTAPVSVDYETQDGAATIADGDYVHAAGTLSFEAGETMKTFAVSVVGDTRPEPNEAFYVILKNPTGAKVGGGASCTILDDESVELSVGDVSVKEGQSGTTPATFTLTLSAPYAAPLMFKYEVTTRASLCDQQHWIASDDVMAPTNNVVTIEAGKTSAQVTVLVNGDVVAEPDEIFYLVVAPGSVPVKGMGKGTIINDDGTPPSDPPCQNGYDGGFVDGGGVPGTAGGTGAGANGAAGSGGGADVDAGADARESADGAGGTAGKGGGTAGASGAAGAGGASDAGASDHVRHGPSDGPPACAVAPSDGIPLLPLLLAAFAIRVAIRRRRSI